MMLIVISFTNVMQRDDFRLKITQNYYNSVCF